MSKNNLKMIVGIADVVHRSDEERRKVLAKRVR